jgi:hypothetical protein
VQLLLRFPCDSSMSAKSSSVLNLNTSSALQLDTHSYASERSRKKQQESLHAK